jgi:hypothetical protein
MARIREILGEGIWERVWVMDVAKASRGREGKWIVFGCGFRAELDRLARISKFLSDVGAAGWPVSILAGLLRGAGEVLVDFTVN